MTDGNEVETSLFVLNEGRRNKKLLVKMYY